MTAMRRAIGLADHHMGMQTWLTVLQGDISHEGEHFHLLIDGNFLVFLLLPIEEPKGDFTQSANRREVAGGETEIFRKTRYIRHDLLARLKNEGERSLTANVPFDFLMDYF